MGRAARASLVANYSVGSWAPSFVSAVAGSRPLAGIEARPGPVQRPKSLTAREHRRSGELLPPSQQTLAPS